MTVKFFYYGRTIAARGTKKECEAVEDYCKMNNQNYKFLGEGRFLSPRNNNYHAPRYWQFFQSGIDWTVETQVQGD